MPAFENTSRQKRALVVKLGGSLHERVPALAPVLRSSPHPLLIVPGGGRYSDAVREAGLPDEEAHWEAVAAMDTYGRYLATWGFDVSDRISKPSRTTVFLPSRSLKDCDPLPHSWDVTSDTIAAWVAGRLDLDLVVLKSVDGIRINGTRFEEITHHLETDVVDPCFIPYILKKGIRATIINGTLPERVNRFLKDEQVPCTRISTTF